MTTPPEGRKDDAEKTRWDLLPMLAVESIVKVLMFGAKKYGADNWQQVPESRRRYYAAAMRHLAAFWNGQRCDPETGLPHLAHAGCCIIFLLALDGS
jgi:hypothetical protein